MAKNLLGFGVSMLLARLLEPRDFGLLGMVLFFVALFSSLQEAGIANAVIYFREDEHNIPTYYSTLLAISAGLAAVLFAGAPAIERFYDTPALTPVVRALSFVILFGGLRGVSQGVIVRQFRLPELSVIETLTGLAAATVAVWMAWQGYGVWSLVANLLLQEFLQTAIILLRVRPRFTLRPQTAVIRKILRWGGPLTGSNILWRFYDNADYLVVAKLFGAAPLGIYTMGFRLATFVNERIGPVVNRVGFVAFASLQDERERLAQHWFSATRYLAIICFPVLTLLAICAEDFLAVVLGEKWLPAAAPVRLLCTVGFLRTLTSLTSSLLSATGHTGFLLRFSLLNAVLLPAAFFAGAQLGGVLGVGVAWNIVFPPLAIYLLRQGARATGVPLASYLANLKAPAFAAGLAGVPALLAIFILEQGATRLVVGVGAGSLTYAVSILSRSELRQQLWLLVRPKRVVEAEQR
jgi:teichuronic acid exporter